MPDLRLSRRIARIRPSATLALDSRAKALKAEGRDVVALTAGEPDFDTPASVRLHAAQLLEKGGLVDRYTPAAGLAQARAAVAKKFERDNGLKYTPEQCILSCGAKHSVFNALAVLVDDGDEVIVPAPFWVSYPEMIAYLGGKAVFVDTSETGFVLTPEALRSAITPRTRAVILNSPGNPTGAVWSEQAQRALAKALEGTEIAVISDEIYEKLVYDGKHVSFAALSEDAYQRTITINGVAKAYAMTGWRIGYAAGPAHVVKAMSALQSHSTSNPTTVAQLATMKALEADPPELAQWREAFRARRDLFRDGLNGLPGVSCANPGGAFYVFPDFRAWIGKKLGTRLIEDDGALCEALLDEELVAGVPGSAFGAPGFVRFSYAASEADLKKALERLAHFAGRLAGR